MRKRMAKYGLAVSVAALTGALSMMPAAASSGRHQQFLCHWKRWNGWLSDYDGIAVCGHVFYPDSSAEEEGKGTAGDAACRTGW